MLLNYIKQGTYATFLFGLASSINRLISFILLPYFFSRLSLEDFGILDFYQTLFSFGTLTLSSCAAVSLTRFYLLHKDDQQKQTMVVSNSTILVIFLGFFSIISGCIISLCISCSFSTRIYLILTSVNAALYALFSILLAYVRVRNELILYVLLFCGQSSFAIILTVYGVMLGYGVTSFFIATALSCGIFLPLCIKVFWPFRWYARNLFIEQLKFSFPLFIYALIFNLFFMVDKIILQRNGGFEVLGNYSLLWRFGSIFQFFAVAVADASPLILYTAAKEQNAGNLVPRLLFYVSMVLTSVAIILIFGAHIGILAVFPTKYHYLIQYLPVFFVPLLFIELGRCLQSSLVIATKTVYIPFVTLFVLFIQVICLYLGMSFGIWGIIIANMVTFFLYMILSYLLCWWMSVDTINIVEIIKLILVFGFCITLMHLFFQQQIPIFFELALVCAWPFLLWFSGVVQEVEKMWIRNYLIQYTHKFINSLK